MLAKMSPTALVKTVCFPLLALITTSESLSIVCSSSFCSQLLVRKIRSQPTNLTHALDLVSELDQHHDGHKRNQQHDKHLVVVEALRVCGKVKRPDVALQLYQKYPSDTTRTMTISVLGYCQQHLTAMKLLGCNDTGDDGYPPACSVATYNAAIAACGKAKDWKRAMFVYREEMPRHFISTLTINALLTVLANCRQGTQALDILRREQPSISNSITSQDIVVPLVDGVSYQLVISALVRSDELHTACSVLEDLTRRKEQAKQKNRPLLSPKITIQLAESIFELVVAAYCKRSNWNGVQLVQRLRHQYFGRESHVLDNNSDAVSNSSLLEIQGKYHFPHWTGLEKVGKGKESFFLLGRYEPMNITIGVNPHRNARKNGMQLLFFQNLVDRDEDWTRKKIGYLLMQNSVEERSSSLLGVYLKPGQRGQGIAKLCIAVWIWFCLKANIVPATGIIQKPLLALILQHTFDFVPRQGGVPVELSRDPIDTTAVVLYSPSRRSLEGALSPWDLEYQNIKIVSQAPEVRGRAVRICSKFGPPSDLVRLGGRCREFFGDTSLGSELTKQDVQQIWLGRSLE
jgi:pentatricopeptide repeat protein